jgi:penicillin-insensitive murein endopeptidase
MVNQKQREILPSFSQQTRELLRQFAERDETDRILVHFSIKRELCRKNANAPWIRKIRPWYGHDHHFHVRIRCAPQDSLCKSGEAIPEGNGCDASLDWWWSEEARAEEKKNAEKRSTPTMPELPSECSKIINPSTASKT